MNRTLLLAMLSLALSGCEQLGIDDPIKVAERKNAEGRAVGSACRHAGRALEDCYALNPKAAKSAVFNGWLEMDGYMRENKMEVVKPEIPKLAPGAKPKPNADAEHSEPAEARPAETAATGKEGEKATTKPDDAPAGKQGTEAKTAQPATERPAAGKKTVMSPETRHLT